MTSCPCSRPATLIQQLARCPARIKASYHEPIPTRNAGFGPTSPRICLDWAISASIADTRTRMMPLTDLHLKIVCPLIWTRIAIICTWLITYRKSNGRLLSIMTLRKNGLSVGIVNEMRNSSVIVRHPWKRYS